MHPLSTSHKLSPRSETLDPVLPRFVATRPRTTTSLSTPTRSDRRETIGGAKHAARDYQCASELPALRASACIDHPIGRARVVLPRSLGCHSLGWTGNGAQQMLAMWMRGADVCVGVGCRLEIRLERPSGGCSLPSMAWMRMGYVALYAPLQSMPDSMSIQHYHGKDNQQLSRVRHFRSMLGGGGLID